MLAQQNLGNYTSEPPIPKTSAGKYIWNPEDICKSCTSAIKTLPPCPPPTTHRAHSRRWRIVLLNLTTDIEDQRGEKHE